MLIVLDTTETRKDLLLNNRSFRTIYPFIMQGMVKLVVPRIVVEETINHAREELIKGLNALGILKKLTPSLYGNMPDPDLETLVNSYADDLRARLAHLKAKQPDYEAIGVTLGSLVGRALQRRKPFDGEGRKGFRDAIIWETVLHETMNYQPPQTAIHKVLLVTKNTHDFGKNGELAEDLKNDLVANGLESSAVTVSAGLWNCVRYCLEPQRRVMQAEKEIQNGSFDKFSALKFYDASKELIRRELNELAADSAEDEGEFRSLVVIALNDVDRFEVCGLWSMDEDTLMMHIDYIVNSRVHFERWQGGWESVERSFQILINIELVFATHGYELLESALSEYQFWPWTINNSISPEEESYLSRG